MAKIKKNKKPVPSKAGIQSKIKKQNIIILSVSSLTAFVIILGFTLDFRSPIGKTATGINYDENYYEDIEQYETPENIGQQPLSPRRETVTKEYQTAYGNYQTKEEVAPSKNFQELAKVGLKMIKDIFYK